MGNGNEFIHLVMGPSSVGKSTFISQQWDTELPVLMAFELPERTIPKGSCVVHYNTLRPFRLSSNVMDDHSLPEDPILAKLMEYKNRLKIYFLIQPKEVIMKRMLLREDIELTLGLKTQKAYPSHKFFQLIHDLNLHQDFLKWNQFFLEHQIDITVLKEKGGIYYYVDRDAVQSEFEAQAPLTFSKDELQLILSKFSFEYQCVTLPHGLRTPGQDRSSTASLIFEYNVNERTVLDVGTAIGYFAFEAESRGAAVVHATELNAKRLLAARILGVVKNSKVKFLKKDFVKDIIPYKYDLVLALNILHHLPYPFYALKQLSDLTIELLILEFPDLTDPKYRCDFNLTLSEDKQPLIAVGDLAHRDQHFLFSREAIQQYLISNNRFFRKINWMQSPMHKSRHLAFCWK